MLMDDGGPPASNPSNVQPQPSADGDLNPPSPLVTEVDDDEDGGPSSVEVNADPSDLSFDLDLPLVSPQPSTSNDIFNEPIVDDQNPFTGMFEFYLTDCRFTSFTQINDFFFQTCSLLHQL